MKKKTIKEKIVEGLEDKKRIIRELEPTPRRNDIVEKIDLSRMFGRVLGTKIEKGTYALVEWKDGLKPIQEVVLITDLALVERKQNK